MLAVVDAVVIENEVDSTSSPVRLGHELVKQVQEQEAVLLLAFDPGESTRVGVQRTGEVVYWFSVKRSLPVLVLAGLGVPGDAASTIVLERAEVIGRLPDML